MVDFRRLMCGDIILRDNEPYKVDILLLYQIATDEIDNNEVKYMPINDEWLAKNFEFNDDTKCYYEAYYDGTYIEIKKLLYDQYYDRERDALEDTFCYQMSIYKEDKEEPEYVFPALFDVHHLQHLFEIYFGRKFFKP